MSNNGVYLQLRIMERLGEMMTVACSDNLRFPLVADSRDICLRFNSKGDCVRSCTCSHASVLGQSWENMLCYIGIYMVFLDPSKKRKFNGGGDQGS